MQKNQVMFILGLIFAIIVTIFALTNSSTVVIHLFFYEVQASQALIIFSSAALGAIIVTLLGFAKHFKLKVENKRLKKENEELQKKVDELTQVTETAVEISEPK